MRRLLLLAAFLLAAASAAAQERVSLPSRPGVTTDVEFIAAAAPRASAVLFPGGKGILAMGGTNFLVRIAPALVAGGFNVALADAPSDRRAGMDPSFRASAETGADIGAIVAFLKSKADLPVWLVGTSNGSVSAANGAARIGPPRIAGAVLTSSVWSGGMSFVPIAQIAVPVLVIHNEGDRCPSAPFAGAQQAMAQLQRAPVKEFIKFKSNAIESAPCEPLAPHGYLGIENQVVPVMVDWMLAHATR
jgi:pimeloyl-ACP methyl ester carboxylesterase